MFSAGKYRSTEKVYEKNIKVLYILFAIILFAIFN